MIRAVALALTFLTGFSGLAYEVAWEKYLATLLGSHSEATAAVLGIFLGSLSVGYWLFGALTRALVRRAAAKGTAPRLLLLYGALEAGIGLYVLAFPWLFKGGLAVSTWLPETGPGLGFALDVGVSALLIGPPAVLMGATVPILTQALARSLEDATRFHAFVYGFNTAGAFLGALAAGFFLIPALGLPGVMHAMGCVNLAAGAVFAVLGLQRRDVVPLDSEAGARPLSLAGFAPYALAAVCVGFAMMAFQTVLIRLGGLSFGASQFTFSMVVAVFVLCIALGSFAVSALPRIPAWLTPVSFWALAASLLLLHGAVLNLPYIAHVVRTIFRDIDASFYPYYLSSLGVLLGLVGLPILLSGATLPLLFHQLRREVGDLGANAGRLYSANTLGSLLGALLGGYWLLLWLDLDHVYRIAVAALGVAAAVVTLRLSTLPRLAAWAMVGATGASLLLTPAWSPERLSVGAFRQRMPVPASYRGADAFFRARLRENLFYDDDPTTSVAVSESNVRGKMGRAIINNGKSDGHTVGDLTTMTLLALLPALFAERTERSLVIGFGTGTTVGELARLEGAQKVEVAEISAGVIEAAPLFDFANGGVSTHPKVDIIQGDAYRVLRRSSERYDVIVSEPPNPWVTGVEMLYSREFLEIARDRLAPGGVYAQWIHEYEIDAEAVGLVLRTYRSVFDHVSVWFAQGPDLMLLAFQDPRRAFDLPRLARRMARPDFAAGLERSRIGGLAALLAHELMPVGVLHALPLHGPLHTLEHPRLNHQAARAFYRGTSSRLPFSNFGNVAEVAQRNSLLGRLAARHRGVPPEGFFRVVATEQCGYRVDSCEAVLARWMESHPDSSAPLAKLEALRAKGKAVSAARVQRVRNLFRASPGGPDATAPIRPAEAQGFSRLYVSHETVAAPFEPRALLGLWDRCQAPEHAPKACERGRTAATTLVRHGTTGVAEAPVEAPDEDS